jgi:Cu/Ag efflux pump CusA
MTKTSVYLLFLIILIGCQNEPIPTDENVIGVSEYWMEITIVEPGLETSLVKEKINTPLKNSLYSFSEVREVDASASRGLSVIKIYFNDGVKSSKIIRIPEEAIERVIIMYDFNYKWQITIHNDVTY